MYGFLRKDLWRFFGPFNGDYRLRFHIVVESKSIGFTWLFQTVEVGMIKRSDAWVFVKKSERRAGYSAF